MRVLLLLAGAGPWRGELFGLAPPKDSPRLEDDVASDLDLRSAVGVVPEPVRWRATLLGTDAFCSGVTDSPLSEDPSFLASGDNGTPAIHSNAASVMLVHRSERDFKQGIFRNSCIPSSVTLEKARLREVRLVSDCNLLTPSLVMCLHDRSIPVSFGMRLRASQHAFVTFVFPRSKNFRFSEPTRQPTVASVTDVLPRCSVSSLGSC